MGLDFSHCEARWSYSGFSRFRDRLANEIGISIYDMCGFGGSKRFDEIKDDIVPLLNHSDCDGVLTPEECQRVAPRLRQLVSRWEDSDYDKQKALELAEGMEYAAESDEDLEFQ